MLMRRHILLLLVVAAVVAVVQDDSRNYIVQQTACDANGLTCKDVIAYYDGLGRRVETVRRNASGANKDLVSMEKR
ncbi:MAG: hypothetical protein IJ724_05925 [Muribaculaceae bacterium]|nr:hypothetical protein [Muribaculaceae bacterium]MBR1726173.1 hypothetical protein [Muribaculaceae bacterium]